MSNNALSIPEATGDPGGKAGFVQFYSKLFSGVPQLFAQDSNNVVYQLSAAGVTGSGSANQVAKWSGTSSLSVSSISDPGTGTVTIASDITGSRGGNTWWSIKPDTAGYHLRLAGNTTGGVRVNYDRSATKRGRFYDGFLNQNAF